MHVMALGLENWLRFRGLHHIDLQPVVYGITASYQGNARRSNWLGKTSTVRAMRFALYGDHHKRTEDEWITRGEKGGGVVMWLATDAGMATIARARTRGKSTKLQLTLGDGRELLGDEAQVEIVRMVGLTLKDFDASVYIGQKQASRFLTEDPAERMKIVVEWFSLGPLQLAADSVAAQLASVQDEISANDAAKRAAREAVDRVMANCEGMPAGGDTTWSFANRIATLETQIARVRSSMKLLEGQKANHASRSRDFEEAKEYHRIVVEGKALRARVEAYLPERSQGLADLPVWRSDLEGLQGELGIAVANVEAKRVLARGEFSGVCPVDDHDCPVKDKINARAKGNAEHLAKATAEHNEISARVRDARAKIAHIEKLDRQYDADVAHRVHLVKDAKRLKPAADRVVGLEEVHAQTDTTNADLESLGKELHALEAQRYNLSASRDLIDAQATAVEKLLATNVKLQSKAELLLEAHHVLGRKGAQARIAQENLAEIEAGANYALAQCGIDLSVAVSWGRETKGLAKNCDACGAPFPPSAKVKLCARCGEPRGQHFEHKLEIVPSDESGAAEDLGGFAVQLAAADWLRRDRAAAWATAIIDEPGAHLDPEHRAALMGHLPGLLKQFSFEQAFVVAHDASAMAAMPAIMHIEADAKGSRFQGESNASNAVLGNEGGARRDAGVAGQVDRGVVPPGPLPRARRARRAAPALESDSERAGGQDHGGSPIAADRAGAAGGESGNGAASSSERPNVGRRRARKDPSVGA